MRTQLRYILSLLLLLLNLQGFAQSDVPLKYESSLPKNLYSAPTAVLIRYTTNKETTEAEDAQIVSRYSTQLLADNQKLKMQMSHFADKNSLLQPAKKQRLLKQYDSLKIENLLILDITEIGGQGAQGSYVLLLTPYNHSASLMSAHQRAYTMQANSYENLIRDLSTQISLYSPKYFIKAPTVEPQKPALTAEPKPEEVTPQNVAKPDEKPLEYPTIVLSVEDQERSNGDALRNFYYYVGADQRERHAGFLGQHLKKDIAASPGALAELNTYRNYKVAFIVDRLVLVGAIIGYASEVYRESGTQFFNDHQKVYIGVAGGSLLLGVLISRNVNQYMRRTIDEYNAFATIRNSSSFYKLKPDSFGFGTIKTTRSVPALTLGWTLR